MLNRQSGWWMVSKSLRVHAWWCSTTTIVSPYICLRDTPKHRVSLAMGQYKSSKHRLSWLWERGGGNINSIWENNEYGWEEGGESSLTPERVVYPKGGCGNIESFLSEDIHGWCHFQKSVRGGVANSGSQMRVVGCAKKMWPNLVSVLSHGNSGG